MQSKRQTFSKGTVDAVWAGETHEKNMTFIVNAIAA